MAPPEPPRTDGENSAVPGLVTDYQAQLDSIRNQARDLVRMRADVLAAAERESQAIVTGARSDIRDILVKARRELLVLAAQVQAVTENDPAPQLGPGSPALDTRDAADISHDRLKAAAASGARQEVRHVLTEARPDLDALTVEAKLLRANLLALHTPDQAARHTPPLGPPDIELTPASDIAAAPPEAVEGPEPQPDDVVEEDRFSIDSRTFGSEVPEPTTEAPVDRLRDADDAEADERTSSAPAAVSSTGRTFVAAFAALALLVVLGTAWWLRSRDAAGTAETASLTTGTQPASESPAPVESTPSTPETPSASQSAAADLTTLTIEARRESWIRALVDGKPDPGRVFDAGETRTITGATRVSIRAGDAGAVFITVNGGEPEPLGPSGRPLTRDYLLADTAVEPASSEPLAPRADDSDVTAVPDDTAPALAAPRAANTPSSPAPLPAQPSAVASVPQTTSAPSVPGRPPTVPAPSAPPAGRQDAVSQPGPTTPINTASAAPTANAAAQEDELVALSQRWLDAYLSGNSSTMLAVSGGTPDIRDQRPPSERLTPGSITAKRSFETPKLQRGADIGVFSVRMTERPQGTAGPGVPPEHVALVSQVWMRRTGKWQLIDVRIVSESQLKPTP